jgi:hypothetical protein
VCCIACVTFDAVRPYYTHTTVVVVLGISLKLLEQPVVHVLGTVSRAPLCHSFLREFLTCRPRAG